MMEWGKKNSWGYRKSGPSWGKKLDQSYSRAIFQKEEVSRNEPGYELSRKKNNCPLSQQLHGEPKGTQVVSCRKGGRITKDVGSEERPHSTREGCARRSILLTGKNRDRTSNSTIGDAGARGKKKRRRKSWRSYENGDIPPESQKKKGGRSPEELSTKKGKGKASEHLGETRHGGNTGGYVPNYHERLEKPTCELILKIMMGSKKKWLDNRNLENSLLEVHIKPKERE